VYKNSEFVDVRNLGTELIEIVNKRGNEIKVMVLNAFRGIVSFKVQGVASLQAPTDGDSQGETIKLGKGTPTSDFLRDCAVEMPASGAFFSTGGLGMQKLIEAYSAPMETVTAPIVFSVPTTGCVHPTDEQAKRYQGKIVVIERGECTFMQKTKVFEDTGAVGVIVFNVMDEDELFMMGADGTEDPVSIPALMVTARHGKVLRRCSKLAASTGNPFTFAVKLSDMVVASLGSSPDKSPTLGSVKNFRYTAMGGWSAIVHEKDGAYQLSIDVG
jgi:PA domain